MARIKTVQDMLDLSLELVDQVLDGALDPLKANSANRLMSTALKTAVAAQKYRHELHPASSFFKPSGGNQKAIGPKFEWDDDQKDSRGIYIGTKLLLSAFKVRGSLYGWKVEMDASTPVLVGEGSDRSSMRFARKGAEECAENFMAANPQLSGNGSVGEYNEGEQEGMWKGMGHG